MAKCISNSGWDIGKILAAWRDVLKPNYVSFLIALLHGADVNRLALTYFLEFPMPFLN